MCIGRIYTDNAKFKAIKFVNVHNDEYVENKNIPTLIIGKKKAENIFGKDKIKVLDKQISENLYWTYGKMEKRNEYERDLENFYKLIFKNISKRADYLFISVYNISFKQAKFLINFLDKRINKNFFILKNHIYFQCQNKILGLSIEEIKYIGVSYNKLINRITKNPFNKIFYDDNFVTQKVKSYTKDNKIFVPLLYFANN